jgi:hypothetical protein
VKHVKNAFTHEGETSAAEAGLAELGMRDSWEVSGGVRNMVASNKAAGSAGRKLGGRGCEGLSLEIDFIENLPVYSRPPSRAGDKAANC